MKQRQSKRGEFVYPTLFDSSLNEIKALWVSISMTVAIAAVRCDNDDILFILSHVPAIEKSAAAGK